MRLAKPGKGWDWAANGGFGYFERGSWMPPRAAGAGCAGAGVAMAAAALKVAAVIIVRRVVSTI
jgi:hypothetical protein